MDLVKQVRRHKGWSQEHLAKVSGVGRATIQRIENGKRVPNKETALSLAEALGIDPERLRSDAGLAGQVKRIHAISLEGPVPEEALAGLPSEIAATFRSHGSARAAFLEANDAAQETTRAGDVLLACTDDRAGAEALILQQKELLRSMQRHTDAFAVAMDANFTLDSLLARFP